MSWNNKRRRRDRALVVYDCMHPVQLYLYLMFIRNIYTHIYLPPRDVQELDMFLMNVLYFLQKQDRSICHDTHLTSSYRLKWHPSK